MRHLDIEYKNINRASYSSLMSSTSITQDNFFIDTFLNLFSKNNFEIKEGNNFFDNRHDYDRFYNMIYEEIQRLLPQLRKNTLVGDYPPRVKRDLPVKILGEEVTINIRNKWHNYVDDLNHIYQTKNRSEGICIYYSSKL